MNYRYNIVFCVRLSVKGISILAMYKYLTDHMTELGNLHNMASVLRNTFHHF